MKRAERVSSQMGVFSSLFSEDLDEFLAEYEDHYADIFYCGCKYFARGAGASLKYGQHGAGPYVNLRMVIESLVSCIPGHRLLFQGSKEIEIYLFPWVEINPSREYRVFVYNNCITAISQQHLYKRLQATAADIEKDADVILKFHEGAIVMARTSIQYRDFVYDIAILDADDTPYFIEYNSFGKNYSSGSALFHWVLDETLLCNTVGDVYLRYVI
jgi:hypothetical protein